MKAVVGMTHISITFIRNLITEIAGNSSLTLSCPIRRTSFSGGNLFVNIQRYVERGRIQSRDHEITTGPVCKNIFSVFVSNFTYSFTCVLEFKLSDRFS